MLVRQLVCLSKNPFLLAPDYGLAQHGHQHKHTDTHGRPSTQAHGHTWTSHSTTSLKVLSSLLLSRFSVPLFSGGLLLVVVVVAVVVVGVLVVVVEVAVVVVVVVVVCRFMFYFYHHCTHIYLTSIIRKF